MTEIANTTPTLEGLLAIEACREASRRYSYGLDRLDPDVMKSSCWPDATVDYGLYVGSAWDFIDRCMTSHAGLSWTMHTLSNHRVELDDDGEHARGDMHNVADLFDGGERRLDTWYGRYVDRYERRDDEWRILHRVCVHHGTTSVHVPEGMPIDASKFRQADFDRPADGRRIGP